MTTVTDVPLDTYALSIASGSGHWFQEATAPGDMGVMGDGCYATLFGNYPSTAIGQIDGVFKTVPAPAGVPTGVFLRIGSLYEPNQSSGFAIALGAGFNYGATATLTYPDGTVLATVDIASPTFRLNNSIISIAPALVSLASVDLTKLCSGLKISAGQLLPGAIFDGFSLGIEMPDVPGRPSLRQLQRADRPGI